MNPALYGSARADAPFLHGGSAILREHEADAASTSDKPSQAQQPALRNLPGSNKKASARELTSLRRPGDAVPPASYAGAAGAMMDSTSAALE